MHSRQDYSLVINNEHGNANMLIQSFFADHKKKCLVEVSTLCDFEHTAQAFEAAATHVGEVPGFDSLDFIGGYVSSRNTDGKPVHSFAFDSASDAQDYFEKDISGWRVERKMLHTMGEKLRNVGNPTKYSLNSVLEICRHDQPKFVFQ